MDVHRGQLHMEKIGVILVTGVFLCCHGLVLDSALSLSSQSLSFPSSLTGAGLSMPLTPSLLSPQYLSSLGGGSSLFPSSSLGTGSSLFPSSSLGTGASLFPSSTLGSGAALLAGSLARAPRLLSRPLTRRGQGRHRRLRGSASNQYQPDRVGGPPSSRRDRTPRPSGGDRPPRPSGGDRTPRPFGGDRAPRPSGGDRAPRPVGADRSTWPVGADRTPRPVGADRSTWPVGADRTPRPVGADRLSRPVGGDRSIPPVGGYRLTRPIGGDLPIRPVEGHINTRPIIDDRATRPLGRSRTTRPVGRSIKHRPVVETRNHTATIPHKNIQITPISWPANKTISIPFRLPARSMRARNITSRADPMTSSTRQRPQYRSPQTSPLGIRGLVSSIRRREPLRQMPKVSTIPKNTTRDQIMKVGRDLIGQREGRATLTGQPVKAVRPSLGRGRQEYATALRGASPLNHPGSRTLPPIVRGHQHTSGLGHKHGPPDTASIKPVPTQKASRQTIQKRMGKMKPIPVLPKKTKKTSVQKGSAPAPPTTTQDPYFAYNGSDLALELNKTLGQYGLDVDGLIALLQDARGDNLKRGSGGAKPVSSITGSGVTPAPVMGNSNSAPSKNNKSASSKNGTTDTPMRILADLQRELNDITRLLEVGGGTGGMKQNIPLATPFVAPNISPDTLVAPTGSPAMEEMLIQHLIQNMGVK